MSRYDRHIESLRNALFERYGEIRPQWEALIDLADEQFDLLERANNSIKQHGMYSPKTGKKNPLITTVKDINNTLLAIYKQLTVTPYTENKLKDKEDKGDEELLKNIMGVG